MASKTKKPEVQRKAKKTKSGKRRKTKNRNQGTTKSKAALFGDKE